MEFDKVVKAFYDWENDVRVNPSNYLTDDQARLEDLGTVSEKRAVHFLSLYKNNS